MHSCVPHSTCPGVLLTKHPPLGSRSQLTGGPTAIFQIIWRFLNTKMSAVKITDAISVIVSNILLSFISHIKEVWIQRDQIQWDLRFSLFLTENMKWLQSTIEQSGNKMTLVRVGPHSQLAYVAEGHVYILSDNLMVSKCYSAVRLKWLYCYSSIKLKTSEKEKKF